MKIYELLDAPEKWTQGTLARTVSGRQVGPMAQTAVCWCLSGALIRCYGYTFRCNGFTPLSDPFWKLSCRLRDCPPDCWNDDFRRTFQEVHNLCVELDI